MPALTLETSVQRTATVIALAGELDLAGAAVLEQELARVDADPARPVVVDLRGLVFMDSSGLRAIATASQRADKAGRPFALVAGADEVMRVFDLTRMRERLSFVDDPREVEPGP